MATEELYALDEQPDVLLRVAAFIRRVLRRTIELRERAGYLDPVVVVGTEEYSLLREEGHGLRELVILLAATYRDDWSLLVVDEPELHLHPAMVRLWLSELQTECPIDSSTPFPPGTSAARHGSASSQDQSLRDHRAVHLEVMQV